MKTWSKTRIVSCPFAALWLLAGAAILPAGARAATFCVDTVAELQAALDDASSNNQNDTILVVRGEYSSPSSYRGVFYYYSNQANSLTIEGDWGLQGEDCTRLWTPSPAQTTITGEGTVPALNLQLGDTAGPLTVKYLTFAHGYSDISSTSGGLTISVGSPGAASLYIHNNMFLLNQSSGFGGGLKAGTSGRLEVINNLFAYNSTGSGHGAASLVGNAVGLPLSPGVEIYNNTVAYNTHTGVGDGGLRIGGNGTGCRIDNNIFWGNEGIDLDIDNSNCSLWNNDIEDMEGTPSANQNAMSVSPMWAGLFQFRLAPSSPLVDQGVVRVGNYSMPDYDLDGFPRLGQPPVDIGAYERQTLFDDGFESGNTNAWSSATP